jgi:cysteine desulfurase/selenocysteine lyase
LVYLDNAATTQKPARVITAITDYYSGYNANIHRGIHTLAEEATVAFEETRKAVARFIGAAESEECIFTRGTTESINLVASTWGRAHLKAGDEILISELEHHSNIVPWYMLCQEKGAILKVARIHENGALNMDSFRSQLSHRTRLVAITFASNALGTVTPVKQIIEDAHAAGAVVMVDAAQAGAHIRLGVKDLDCDFLALSAHKMYGPTGVGILYGKRALLEAMPPYQGGGEMIRDVSHELVTWNDIPYKFEAGTPNIGDVIAFAQAIAFIEETGREKMAVHEAALNDRCTRGLLNLGDRVKLKGTAPGKLAICSFVIEGMHHFDVGMMLDAKGIAVRTGHHCTQPLMRCLGIEGTIRPSFAAYNTAGEVDVLLTAVEALLKKGARG